MAKARMGPGLLAGCLATLNLFLGSTAFAANLPTVKQMLSYQPKQEGVPFTTPTQQEESACKVEFIKGQRQGSGYVLRDARGLPLRRFYNTKFVSVEDKTKMDLWSYYKDGVEVYREWAAKNGEPADNFRWMNANGSKWGVDTNGDGKIDAWKMISAEEVSQEVLQAVATNDLARLQALFLNDAEIKALELSAAEASRITELRKGVAAKFKATVTKVALSDKTRWLHVETAAPQCLPLDQSGASRDLIKYANATIMCDTNGKNEWLQTGEIYQVGYAWRIVDAPTVGLSDDAAAPKDAVTDKALQALLEQLRQLDSAAPKAQDTPGPNADVQRYNVARADLLEKIVAQVKQEERDPWIRQVADCLSAAAQAATGTDKAAYQRLVKLEEQIVGPMPGTSLAAYITFREMTTDYALKINEKDANFAKIQEGWLERLAKFVQTYPKTEDAADALLQLGMVSEMLGKEKEPEAKKWYQQLAANFADKPIAAKAQGAIRRLDLEGKALELSSPTLTGGAFDIARLQGKIVVVYYWASWSHDAASEFAKLKLLVDNNSSKGVELVTVNLDNKQEEATDFLKQTPLPGTHLFQPGGLDSPLATQYGIMGLPNLFLVGKDGKVVSRTVQINNLEDEVRKLTK
jgi:thiol-disulfide isomerase/thioredoxin